MDSGDGYKTLNRLKNTQLYILKLNFVKLLWGKQRYLETRVYF